MAPAQRESRTSRASTTRERTAGERTATEGGPDRRPPSRRRQARRDRLRRWIAAALAGLGAFVLVSTLGSARAAESGVPTLVAARDLPAGTVLSREDLELATRAASGRPATGITAYGTVVGKVTAGPISARDTVTPERLVGPGLLAGQPAGHMALTLPVLGGGTAGVSAGAHVDVYATGTGQLAAQDVVVLALTEPAESAFGAANGASGPNVTVALAPADAGRVATALSALQAGESFVLALRRP